MNDLKMLLGAILVVVLLIVVACIILAPFFAIACNAETKDIGIPHRWSLFGDCQVQENGNWIPLENWRYLGNP